MRRLFQGWDIQAVSKIISPRQETVQKRPGSHYYCLVDFATAKEAQDAVDRLDHTPTEHGGTYRLAIAHKQGNKKVMREQKDMIATLTLAPTGEPATTRSSIRPTATNPAVKRDLNSNWRRRD